LTDANGANVSYTSGLGSQYRTEIESFSQIMPIGQAGYGPASFIVKTKAGLTMEYGGTDKSRIEAQGNTNATVAIWAINKITDIRGNSMSFAYNEDRINGEFSIASISYGGNVVTFVYDTTQRPDIQTGYQAGSKITLSQRLKSIKTWAGSSLMQQTALNYAVGTNTKQSILSSVQICDGANQCLEPTLFSEVSSSIKLPD
jgi:hypothetical protein